MQFTSFLETPMLARPQIFEIIAERWHAAFPESELADIYLGEAEPYSPNDDLSIALIYRDKEPDPARISPFVAQLREALRSHGEPRFPMLRLIRDDVPDDERQEFELEAG
ncbi:MAG: hypothetical protein AAF658_13325 [Myxococcota bacterium]